MDEMRFYKNHTKYDDFFVECRDAWLDYKGRYHRDEVSDEAKIKALHDWVRTHRYNIESMMLQEEFPPSLETKVRPLRPPMAAQSGRPSLHDRPAAW